MYLKYYDDPSRDEYLPLLRRSLVDDSSVRESVQGIIDEVIRRGDEALREYELRFCASTDPGWTTSPSRRRSSTRPRRPSHRT